MGPLHSFKDYLYNLETTSKAEAKRMWRKSIKDQWEQKCAYCESTDNITLDHVLPQCKGGLDIKTNVVACCHSCNQDKGYTPWEEWYLNQHFFSEENYQKIKLWIEPDRPDNLYAYPPRKNYISN